MTPKITANMEDYLETIHLIEAEQGSVRVKDIAGRMCISCASVSEAVKSLDRQGLVSHPRYDLISLTERGAEIARRIYERHRIIRRFLRDVLLLDAETAEEDACRIEHSMSPKTVDRLREFLEASR